MIDIQILNYIVNTPIGQRPQVVRDQIVCDDGTVLSVQASEGHYCSPRDNSGSWSSVEVMIDGNDFAPEWFDYISEVYVNYSIAGWVPVEFVREMIGNGRPDEIEPNWLQDRVNRVLEWLRS